MPDIDEKDELIELEDLIEQSGRFEFQNRVHPQYTPKAFLFWLEKENQKMVLKFINIPQYSNQIK